jgi:amino acid permease
VTTNTSVSGKVPNLNVFSLVLVLLLIINKKQSVEISQFYLIGKLTVFFVTSGVHLPEQAKGYVRISK